MLLFFFFFFKQKTAYEMRISDWSSDVCSSDLGGLGGTPRGRAGDTGTARRHRALLCHHHEPRPALPRQGRGRPELPPRHRQGLQLRRVHAPDVGAERKSVVEEKSVSVRVDLGGRSNLKKKKNQTKKKNQ